MFDVEFGLLLKNLISIIKLRGNRLPYTAGYMVRSGDEMK